MCSPLDMVVSEFYEWFNQSLDLARDMDGGLYKDAHPNDDTELMCTFYYNGDAIVGGKVTNAWVEYKYNCGGYNETGDGSYHPESIFIDVFQHGMQILYKNNMYMFDNSFFSTEPTEEEVFQFSTIESIVPLNDAQLLKLVRCAKKLDFVPEDEREYMF